MLQLKQRASYQQIKQHMRHTIVSRQFGFIAAGEVDHLTRLELGSVDGIKSQYCFMGTNGSEGELQFTERSCYECEA